MGISAKFVFARMGICVILSSLEQDNLQAVDETKRDIADLYEEDFTDGVMKLMEELKRSGTIRFAGITAHSEKATLLALQNYDFDTLLFPFNWQMNLAAGYGNEVMRAANPAIWGSLA